MTKKGALEWHDRKSAKKIGRVVAITLVKRRKDNTTECGMSIIPLYTLSLYKMPAWLQRKMD